MPINIGKLRFVDFTSVSVKFTFETSVIEMPTMLIIVTKDAKFSEYIALKGNSGLSTSWAQMKEHEKSKRTSHY